VTGLARIFLVFGLLVLVAVLMVLWRDNRTVFSKQPSTSTGEPQVGRSTLSHGGPGVGGSPGAQERQLNPAQHIPSDQSPYATKR
jgi:hypothetical protein